MTYSHYGPAKKKPTYKSKRYGFEVYWTWRRPFVHVVKFSIWGYYGPDGCSIRAR